MRIRGVCVSERVCVRACARVRVRVRMCVSAPDCPRWMRVGWDLTPSMPPKHAAARTPSTPARAPQASAYRPSTATVGLPA